MAEKVDSKEPVVKPIEIRSKDREVKLKEFTLEEAEEIFTLIDQNRKHMAKHKDATEKIYKTLDFLRRDIKKPRVPQRKNFTIRNKEGILVGLVSITSDGLGLSRNKGEIAYALGEDFQRRGYATRAVETLTNYAFKKLRYRAVYGWTMEKNVDSIDVLKGAGFKEVERFANKVRFEKDNPHRLVG